MLSLLSGLYLGVVGVHKDGGVGLTDPSQDGRSQHGVQEGLVDCLHLHLVSVSRLHKLSRTLRHRGAKAVEWGGHRVNQACNNNKSSHTLTLTDISLSLLIQLSLIQFS